MRKIVLTAALFGTLTSGLAATAWGQVVPEFRPFVGAYFPTGDQRDVLKDAFLVGGQVAVEVAEQVHLLGTFGFVPNKDRTRITQTGVSTYQYDVGLEAFRLMPFATSWEFRPFVGAGAGARTIDPDYGDSNTNFAGYASLGAEFQTGKVALRLEGRDYLTRFKGLTGTQPSVTRNDIMMMTGLAFHW